MDSSRPPPPTPTGSDKILFALLLLIFATSFAVRLYKLDGQTLECDEFYTIPAATGHQYVYLTNEGDGPRVDLPFTTSEHRKLVTPDPRLGLTDVRSVLKRNVHLPLYFYLMHYWVGWFGTSEWTLRFPSAFFGALAAVMMFLLGKELFTPLVGIVSTIFLAFAPEQIFFAQQARMYTLLTLLIVTSTYLLVLALRRPESNWPFVVYAIASVAGLYTHYEYVFCLAGQTAFLWLAAPETRRHWRRWLTTQSLIALAFSPWVLVSLAQKKTSPEVIAWVNGSLPANLVLTELVAKTARFISVAELPLGWLSVILCFVLLLIGFVSLGTNRQKLFLLASWIAFPILGVLLMDRLLGTRAISITRYWMVIAPALYLVIGVGIDRIKKRPVQIVLVALLGGFLVAAALLTAQGKLRSKPDQHKELAQYVDGQIAASSNAIVLTEGLNALPLALGYYAEREMIILRHKWLVDQLAQKKFNQLTNGATEVFLVVSGQSHAVRLLEENGFRLEGKPVQHGHVITAKYVLRSSQLP